MTEIQGDRVEAGRLAYEAAAGKRRGAVTAVAEADTDAVVIGATLEEPARFTVLYDRYAAQLFRFASRRVGESVADDVVAETFLAAFRHRDRYDRNVPCARPWLFGILVRQIARHQRDETTRYRAIARMPSDLPVPGMADRVADVVDAGALRAELLEALAELSTGDRDVLLLYAWGELSYMEIADAVGIPVGTVRSRLNRARRNLRHLIPSNSVETFLGKETL